MKTRNKDNFSAYVYSSQKSVKKKKKKNHYNNYI